MKNQDQNAQQPAHTPIPWCLALGKNNAVFRKDTFICVADCNSPTVPPDEQKANAAFIVRACNAHDELVEACKAALGEVCNHEHGHEKQWRDVYAQLQSALKKASQP